MVTTISPSALADLCRSSSKTHIIDVRTPAEYGEVHVDGARNVPLDRLDPQKLRADLGEAGGAIYFVCKSGNRSQKACEKMLAAGITNVVSIEGGTTACETAGLPVIRGRKAMSLERQVRIAAGALVAGGAVVAAFAPEPIKPWGLGVAGFVGAGLVFAGLTDTCGMAMLIAKMPWNQACRGATRCARSLLAVLLTAAACATALAAEHTRDSLPTVQQAVADQQAVILDVREEDEWRKGHLSGARLLPLSRLEAGMQPADIARLLPKDKIIYCHCALGGRCLEAASILQPLGYDVRPLKPGYAALVQAGFPAVVGQ